MDLKKTINEEFNHLLSCCSANKLSVHFKKTHHMTISFPPKANKLNLNLRNIEEKNYIKYLGIYIDKNLNWAPHIQHINSKISKNLVNPFQITPFLNFKHHQTNILLTYLPQPSLWNCELRKHIPK